MKQQNKYVLCLALMLLVAIVGEPCRAAEPGADAKAVRSFLDAHCVRCHGKEDPEGKVSLHALAFDSKAPQDVETWKRVYEQLFNGQMPPPDRKQPSSTDRQFEAERGQDSLFKSPDPLFPFENSRRKLQNVVTHSRATS